MIHIPIKLSPPVKQLVFAAAMLVVGSVSPIIIIRAYDTVPAWKIAALEVIGFSGLALLLAQLALKTRLPIRLYAGLAIPGLLIIGLAD